MYTSLVIVFSLEGTKIELKETFGKNITSCNFQTKNHHANKLLDCEFRRFWQKNKKRF